MPIQVQCCGLALLIILMFLYKSQKTIKLRTEKAFMSAFVMTIISICLDILSCVAITYMDVLPVFLVKLVCKSYLVTLLGESVFALLYICTDIYSASSSYRRIMMGYGAFAFVVAVLIYALPIYIFLDKDKGTLYTYGPSAVAAFAFAFITLAITVVRVVKEKRKISRRKRMSVLIWLGVWTLGAVIQMFFPKLLLVSFAGVVGILVLYLMLENPGNNIDRQTGLFNHGAFVQFTRELYNSDKTFAALAIVLDHTSFKTMRTDVEREIIAEASRYLSSVPGAVVFKNTGTEILMLFPDRSKADNAVKAVLERFELGWSRNKGVMVHPHWIYLSDSSLADDAEDLLYLIRYVKQNTDDVGENNFIEVKRELAAKLRKEKETEQLIAEALQEDRLEVWYQPIYSTKNQHFTAAEALVRMRDRDGKLIPPGRFIGIAERNGSILQLGETVFRKVCRFMHENNPMEHGIKYIEVNLSMVQCAYSNLAKDYISVMEEYGISPDMINLEITESASTNAKKVLLENMRELMDYGVNFSLDDFGTGQSNLDYIADMPVEIVKFDKGMTNAYFESGKTKYIMDAATNMIKGMNLKIVSEGIETEEQYNVMKEMGINYIQGYYFSKPLPENEFLEFIKKKNGAVKAV